MRICQQARKSLGLGDMKESEKEKFENLNSLSLLVCVGIMKTRLIQTILSTFFFFKFDMFQIGIPYAVQGGFCISTSWHG